MKITNKSVLLLMIFLSGKIFAQQTGPFYPDFKNPEEIPGMRLVWHCLRRMACNLDTWNF
jgi:hypothetical protein